VLVDEADGIIAGHGRVLAAHKLGIAEIPVMVAAGWTAAQKRAYVLADNKLALNAGWDDAGRGSIGARTRQTPNPARRVIDRPPSICTYNSVR
jgi:ParB-like chromosome segregation protein Spo0J